MSSTYLKNSKMLAYRNSLVVLGIKFLSMLFSFLPGFTCNSPAKDSSGSNVCTIKRTV